MTKKKEKVAKKKEEEIFYVSDTHCTDGKCITSSGWGKKRKLAVPRDLTIESFKNPKEPYVIANYRLNAKCIDEAPYVRGPKPPPPYDPFLAYLEFKMSKPWYERMFLP